MYLGNEEREKVGEREREIEIVVKGENSMMEWVYNGVTLWNVQSPCTMSQEGKGGG